MKLNLPPFLKSVPHYLVKLSVKLSCTTFHSY